MIRETLLPDLQIRAKFFPGAEREPTLDELDGFFQTRLWGKENVNVIGHNYKLMRQICGAVIVAKAFDELLGLTALPQRLKSRSSFFLFVFCLLRRALKAPFQSSLRNTNEKRVVLTLATPPSSSRNP